MGRTQTKSVGIIIIVFTVTIIITVTQPRAGVEGGRRALGTSLAPYLIPKTGNDLGTRVT